MRDEDMAPVSPTTVPGLARPSIRVPVDLDDEVWGQALRYAFLYSVAGLVLGLACVLGGLALFLNGVAGSTSWVASMLGLQSSLTDAAPGAVLFVTGLIVVLITRYNVKTETRLGGKGRRGQPG